MSSTFDLTDIANYYSKKSDDEIVLVATENASGLRPGVLEIIQNEIKKRNLNPELLKGAAAQSRVYSQDEIESLAEVLQNLRCPVCGSKTSKLNGTVMYTVKSFILFSSLGQEPVIACPDCLDRKNRNAIISTSILGWWGIPSGILNTPVYIYRNLKAKKENQSPIPNDTLLEFTRLNVGRIETYKSNPEKLQQLISYIEV